MKQSRMKFKKQYSHLFIWLVVLFFVGGSIFGIINFTFRQQQNLESAIKVDAVSPDDWVKGNRDAKIVLIEYSDFQCPACGFYFPLLKKLEEEFGENIAIVYRHFPLSSIHPNAKAAAYAAEAAGKQGKFWEMHDLIFSHQTEWSDKGNVDEIFVRYAQILNLNIDQFKKDFSSKEIKQKIENSYKNALKLGLDSTPTFFLNGKKIPNPRDYEDFKNIIIENINKINYYKN
jgi:protein-disulfide isomerase